MSDIVDRLRAWASIKDGERVPPELAGDCEPGHWGDALRKLHHDAISEIERLRSIAGKADVGQSFSQLTNELRHQTP